MRCSTPGCPPTWASMLAHRGVVREPGCADAVELWADGGMRTAADVLQGDAAGRKPGRVRDDVDGGPGLHDLPRLPARLPATSVSRPRSRMPGGRRARRPALPAGRPVDAGVTLLTRFLAETAAELRRGVAALGARRAQELVGRSDLLVQARGRRPARPGPDARAGAAPAGADSGCPAARSDPRARHPGAGGADAGGAPAGGRQRRGPRLADGAQPVCDRARVRRARGSAGDRCRLGAGSRAGGVCRRRAHRPRARRRLRTAPARERAALGWSC